MGERLTIRLEVYLPFRGQSHWRGTQEIPAGTTAEGLLSFLGLEEPDLVVLVNGRGVSGATLLKQGDEVAVLRRAEGG
ncbi:MAG TPA: MoaD/ThiS family protein [Symbiobacteriaceae bacterium]